LIYEVSLQNRKDLTMVVVYTKIVFLEVTYLISKVESFNWNGLELNYKG